MKRINLLSVVLCLFTVSLFLTKATGTDQAIKKSPELKIVKPDKSKLTPDLLKKKKFTITGQVFAPPSKESLNLKQSPLVNSYLIASNIFVAQSTTTGNPPRASGNTGPTLSNVCIQSLDGSCAISGTNGSYTITVGYGQNTLEYNRCEGGYLTHTENIYVTQDITGLNVTLVQSSNQGRLICGTISWGKSVKPSCIELSLIQQSCTPILIKTVKSCCPDNSSTGLFAFGVDLTNGDYSVEVIGQGCNNWQNCTRISITGQGTAPFQCSIYGTSCP